MEAFKSAVRYSVLTFVLIAAAISVAGLDQTSQGNDPINMTVENENSPAEFTAPKKDVVASISGSTG